MLKHDGSLWLAQGPYANNQAPDFVTNNVISFGAADPGNLFVIDGNLNLWQLATPFLPQNNLLVDQNVVACQPLFPSEQLIGQQRPFQIKRPLH